MQRSCEWFLLIVGWLIFLTIRDVFMPIAAQGGGRQGIVRIRINPNGEQGNGISRRAAVAADGGWVAFSSNSFNLTDEDQSPVEDVFVYERAKGELDIISTVAEGEAQDGDSRDPALSADGSVVVFASEATNLSGNDTNQQMDIFLWETIR